MNNEKATHTQVYLTSDQLHRLSGIACDALVGVQLESDCDSSSDVTGSYVSVDDPSGALRFFRIDAEGRCEVST